MNSRALTLASLLGIATPALAGAPHQKASVAQQSQVQAAPLEGTWTVSVQENVLVVELRAKNAGDASQQVLVRRGNSPGAHLTAMVTVNGQQQALQAQLSQNEMRDMMSRMGPMPHYEALAANNSTLVGTWRFEIPADASIDTVAFAATIFTGTGSAEITHKGLTTATLGS